MTKEIACFFCKQDIASQTVWDNIQKDFRLEDSEKVFDGYSVRLFRKNQTIYWLLHTDKYIYKDGRRYAKLVEREFPDAQLAIIVGFHSGKSGAILTVHSMGNPTAEKKKLADSYQLARTSCKATKNAVLGFKRYRDEFELDGFEVTQEATHGSPVEFKIPIIDFEIGSTEVEYRNEVAGRVLAHTLFDIDDPIDIEAAVGVGGLHYADKFAKVNMNGMYAVGHVLPSSCLKDFNKELLEQVRDKTVEGCNAVILDKKERGEYKALVKQAAEELGMIVINHNQAVTPSKRSLA